MTQKILVLAIAGGTRRYAEMEEACRQTWAQNKPEGMEVFFVKGRDNYFEKKLYGLTRRVKSSLHVNILGEHAANYLSNVFSKAQVVVRDDVCWVDVPDTWFILSVKTLKAFSYFLHHSNFDYVFRTNLGSYLDLESLKQFLSRLPRDKVYVADKVTYPNENKYKGLVYGSGSGFGLSRDVVENVVQDMNWMIAEQLYNYGTLIDDMQFGDIITNKYRIPLIAGRRRVIDVRDLEQGKIEIHPLDYHYYLTGAKDRRHHFILEQLIKGGPVGLS